MLSNDWAAIKKCRCHLSPAVAALLLASHPLSSLTEPHYIHIYIYIVFIYYLLIFGCAGPSLLRSGFL